jgi:hypothetical protein
MFSSAQFTLPPVPLEVLAVLAVDVLEAPAWPLVEALLLAVDVVEELLLVEDLLLVDPAAPEPPAPALVFPSSRPRIC